MVEWYIDHDNSGHKYLVPLDMCEEFRSWTSLDEDDPKSWDAPDYAVYIDGGRLTFTNPKIAGVGITARETHNA